jgi:hypothetical protein
MMIPLSPFAREILDASMDWMDARFDGLLYYASEAGSPSRHIVRESTYYALGLLERGDAGRAAGVLHAILDHQINEPGAVYHGTFLRYTEEAHPQPGAVEWRDYDPNWRDFIGTGFALALIFFEEQLPVELVARIERSLRLAVEGTLARAVRPGYTNIALMDAYLLHFAGMRLDEPAWCAAGETLAQRVHDLFAQTGAFEEYNSPTYYGTDLYALALWRGFSDSSLLRELGAKMEAGLWRDIASFYHAGLRNLAGPWDRSYGMDMTRYASLLGLWIWLGVGREHGPFPDTTRPFEHAFDACFGPCAALAGTAIPDDALAHFQAFQDAREVERTITLSPLRVATAWLGKNVMLGAEFTGQSKMGYFQFHPLTIHWRATSGEVGWAKLIHTIPVDVHASERCLSLIGRGPVAFRVYSPAGAEIEPARWRLDGLLVTVEAKPQDVKGFRVTRVHDDAHPDLDLYEIHYQAGQEEEMSMIIKTVDDLLKPSDDN